MTPDAPSRDDLCAAYLDQIPYDPYPFQEEALLSWFSAEQGVLVCAPTGMGKTLIAEAALFEALHAGQMAYYTTPLIALTEQKFREMQQLAIQWGFQATDVGLVTGNRRENPDARILVVVAEILANRLLHGEQFDFDRVGAVVMDEFHSFADPERGIVWELTLGLLPQHVRILLLSATVGNSLEFVNWLRASHNRRVELVQGSERRVPLEFHWVPDTLLPEQLEEMAAGDEAARRTPALVFCFNREECWRVAEQIKGKRVLSGDQQARLAEVLKHYDFSEGAGPKLRHLLLRGVGVHHAGVLPKYRRIVEELFQRKLLSIATCTETLSAGINLPARSVVLPSIIKGPTGKKRVIDASGAHQIFGRAGRPQFDTRGYVFALAHEDDVKIARWKERFDQIPEGTKDPGLLKARKALKRKMPTRRSTEQYWNQAQFEKLCAEPPGKLSSRGPLPWRLLAHMLDASPEVDRVRRLVSKRLMDSRKVELGQKALEKMLITLWRAGYVELEPEPPKGDDPVGGVCNADPADAPAKPDSPAQGIGLGIGVGGHPSGTSGSALQTPPTDEGPPPYRPEFARPTPDVQKLLLLRGINPLYGVFLVNQLGIANRQERIQAIESVLELPRSVGHFVRVPGQDELPPGPLATTRLDVQLLQLGLAAPDELAPPPAEEGPRQWRHTYDEAPKRVLVLAQKLRMLFDYDFPGVHDVRTSPVWAAGELLELGGDFNKYVTSRQMQKQEGVVFRHLLRLILLIGEFLQFCPPDTTEEEWRGDLQEITSQLTQSCRAVDPSSTEKALEEVEKAEDLGE